MMRQPELPPVSELLAIEEDAVLSDPSPDSLFPTLRSLGEPPKEGENDGLGFRSLLERPEALPNAWPAAPKRRARRPRRRRIERAS